MACLFRYNVRLALALELNPDLLYFPVLLVLHHLQSVAHLLQLDRQGLIQVLKIEIFGLQLL